MQKLVIVLLSIGALLIASCQGSAVQPTGTPAPTSPTEEPAAPTEEPATEAPAATEASATEASPTEMPVTATATTSASESETGAADADVERVRAVQNEDGTWTFHVTVRHPDTGWEDYANGWDVVTSDGTVLKPNPDDEFTRVLLHPHENEQPFTRSQSDIEIPEGVTEVRVRAHDIVDGFGGQEVVVDLTTSEGENYEVEGTSSG